MLDFEDVKKAVKFRRRSRLNFLVNKTRVITTCTFY